MHSYEVEIKVLLWDETKKNQFMTSIWESFPGFFHEYSESQLNHYFHGWSLEGIWLAFSSYIDAEQKKRFENIQDTAKSFSVRTRGTKDQTLLVIKATVNNETSSNGTARIEWEVDLFPMTLDEMDTKLLRSAFEYQAKWSRARDSYKLNQNTILCLDKNAGYGYLAEFERVIDDESLVDLTRWELLEMIHTLGYNELNQERLARMFEFYNQNWRDYYGTEKVFTIE